MNPLDKKILRSKCQEILRHSDALEYIVEQIAKESTSDVDAETAFLMAKQAIRQKAMKEGAKAVLLKLNKYADEHD